MQLPLNSFDPLSALALRFVNEGPGVRPIELSDGNRLKELWLEVPKVHSVLIAWLGCQGLPMRYDPAELATQVAKRSISPDVFGGVLRVPFDEHGAKLVVRPQPSQTPANRAVAAGRFVWGMWQREAHCTAVTGTMERRKTQFSCHDVRALSPRAALLLREPA